MFSEQDILYDVDILCVWCSEVIGKTYIEYLGYISPVSVLKGELCDPDAIKKAATTKNRNTELEAVIDQFVDWALKRSEV